MVNVNLYLSNVTGMNNSNSDDNSRRNQDITDLFLGIPHGRDCNGDLGTGESIIVKWISEKEAI
jgi:hypothetical protein